MHGTNAEITKTETDTETENEPLFCLLATLCDVSLQYTEVDDYYIGQSAQARWKVMNRIILYPSF